MSVTKARSIILRRTIEKGACDQFEALHTSHLLKNPYTMADTYHG